MPFPPFRPLVGGLIGLLIASGSCAARQTEAAELFAHRVLPTFKAKCLACHGDDPEKIKGDLDMRTREGLLTGGESEEPSLVPGKPEESPLYLATTRDHEFWEPMPPKDNDKLSAEQVAEIRDWIAAGAPWPDDEELAALVERTRDKWAIDGGVEVPTSGGLAAEWTHRTYEPENLWAYQPLEKPEVPAALGENPIDAFLARGLAERELAPAPLADRRTLIRRVAFDLVGLPPTPEEIQAFLEDPLPDEEAFAKVVERLLSSPHYGERWAQHWLDVVRYADSSGFANDYVRGNTWRYRDYVIRSFNEDKAYDQFVREQLAGDEFAPDDPEMRVATGFLRMGPWELTGMEVPKVARQRFLDDATDIVGQTFLAHMLQCARCHDHKFDPVPTRDYYAMQAVFSTTQLAEREAPFLDCENRSGFDEERKILQARQRAHQATLQRVNAKRTVEAGRAWLLENGRDPSEFDQAAQALGKKPTLDAVRKRMQNRKVDPSLIPPRHAGFTPQDYGLERVARKGLERLKWEFDRYEPVAFSVYNGRTPERTGVKEPVRVPADRLTKGELEQAAILSGGDPFSPTEPVKPGVLSVVNNLNAGLSARVPETIEGRRLALAEWITHPRNPLTPRVMANRIWQWHFGQALAGNPNNFGATGKKPSHPKLLDWLAATFVEEGWSVKAMHRLILSSEAYRRAAHHPDPDALAAKDPDGTSFAVFQPRRLTAEELRDAMLAASGELNLELGGIPARPEMNPEAAMQPRQVMGTFAEAWQPNPLPGDRHRRSVYVLRIRGQRDPMMEVFNAPSPDLSCEAREASTVTPQVFSLFNSQSSYNRAVALAARLQKETGSRAEAVDRLFLLLTGRGPEPDERAACLEHWEAMSKRHRGTTIVIPPPPTEVERTAVEENTGEKFTFTEQLAANRDFVPDLTIGEVDLETRGLAELCLVLLNSNEFAYVY